MTGLSLLKRRQPYKSKGCTEMANGEYILEMSDISKSFGPVKALKGVNLKVRKGTVHALMGENGAGKSTLMKCLIGINQKDSGTIIFKGNEINCKKPAEALGMGISMIHQELSPVLDMTVADNLWLGREEIRNGVFVDTKKNYEKTQKYLDEFELTNVKPSDKLRSLSIGEMQLLEIAKAISYNSDLIIMDEPTSSISQQDVELLFKIIRRLKEEGKSFIYISHKMDEIFQISDDITVFRDGEYVGTDESKNLDNAKLVKMMVGRELKDLYDKVQVEIGEPVLEVEHLSNGKLFQDVSFTLRKGEILGMAGLVGAGRSEVVETIFGMRGKYEGTIKVFGKEVTINSPADAMKCGIALCTEDRKRTGLSLGLSIRDNMSITVLKKMANKLGLVNRGKVQKYCDEQVEKLHVKVSSIDNPVKTLSGGNQQKVVLAKWLHEDTQILILDEPTRGIDIGAKNEIYKLMEQFVENGNSVIMVSSEMPEILGMSDRIVVMGDGKLRGIIDGTGADQIKVASLFSD